MKFKSLLNLLFFIVIVPSVYAAGPTITSFAPQSGYIGSIVTITGTNLGSPTNFTIGGKAAIIISGTDTQLVGMVMPGAVTGAISLTTAGGSVTANTNFSISPTSFPSVEEGGKLTNNSGGQAGQGNTVAVSADGNTAVVSGANYNSSQGAIWIYTRNNGVWAQQGDKLIGTGAVGNAEQGVDVAISADGNTVISGGSADNGSQGAAWIFTRSNGVWSQQGSKLVGTGAVNMPQQGFCVSISADGNTAISGGFTDNYGAGAAWIFTRSNGVWTQQGNKLVGTGNINNAEQGYAVAISADGNTAILGGITDNNYVGAAWIFTRTNGVWAQQGNKLTGSDASNLQAPQQGSAVALSADGNTAMIGGKYDNQIGANWIFTRSNGTWSQQGSKLVGSGSVTNIVEPQQGIWVGLSADGNTAISGGSEDNNSQGALWVFTRDKNNIWAQQGSKIVGTGGSGQPRHGFCLGLSLDGTTLIDGAPGDNSNQGAAWVFKAVNPTPTATTQAAILVTKTTARLNGTANDNGGVTTVNIEYGTTADLSDAIAAPLTTGVSPIAPGTGDVSFTSNLKNLIPGTTYYYRINSINGYTVTHGDIMNFTTVALPPTITSFSPATGPAGTLITITGTDLTDSTSVTIGGKPAIIISDTKTQLVAMVMPGAVTGGIKVSTSSGNATNAGPFTVVPAGYPSAQLGDKLAGEVGTSYHGQSVAVSADGSTTLAGSNNGCTVYIRSGNTWVKQTVLPVIAKAAALSADGNTAAISNWGDNSNAGAAWVFTRGADGTWVQQGNKLIPSDNSGAPAFGNSISLSADGNTMIIGGSADNSSVGAAWIFARSNNTWSQQGAKLVGSGYVGGANQGGSVALSADGNTAIVGGRSDKSNAGAAWVFTRGADNTWAQQGGKLAGTGAINLGQQGSSVALNADGNTAVVGGLGDNFNIGAAWVFTRTGDTWTQQSKLIGSGNSGQSFQGYSVAISADGNTVIAGGYGDANYIGATWVFTRSGSSWKQRGNKLVGTGYSTSGDQGISVALSADGYITFIGGQSTGANGAAWVFKYVQLKPDVKTLAATAIKTTGATLNGVVNDNYNKTAVSIEYSTSPVFSGAITAKLKTGVSPILPGTGDVSFTSILTGLTPGTVYYYRINGIVDADTTHGPVLAFVTQRVPVAAPAISYVNPAAYKTGVTIAALAPTNSGGAVPATPYGQVTNLAGKPRQYGSANGTGPAAKFSAPCGITTDAAGNVYVADLTTNLIKKITPAGVVTTFAGSGNYSSVNGTGVAASFRYPASLATDAMGNIYVAETNANLIRKITPDAVVTTFAGTGVSGSNNGPVATATFYGPQGIAIDGSGNIYVSERLGNRVRKITPDGMVSTVAGSGSALYHDGTGTAASFNQPFGITVDDAGILYVADQGNNVIRKITPAGVVTTLAGAQAMGSANGQGSAARFSAPAGITIDDAGMIYVADQGNNTIRRINAAGVVTTLAGKGNADTTTAAGTLAGFTYPQGLTADHNGKLYLADMNNYVVRSIVTTGYSITPELPSGLNFDASTGVISGVPAYASPVAPYTVTACNQGGNSAVNVRISVAAAAAPKISYTALTTYTVGTAIAPLSPANTGGAVTSSLYLQKSFVAGGAASPGTNGTGAEANIDYTIMMRADAAGNLYSAEPSNNMIRKITPAGVVTTIAGNSTAGSANGTGTAASFNNPTDLALDKNGNIYVADRGNRIIRKITPAGVVTTLAGNGNFNITDGTGTTASFQNPTLVVCDAAGNVLVYDSGSLRKITPAGVVTTIQAGLPYAGHILIDASDNLYMNDTYQIRKLTPAGVLTNFGNPNGFQMLAGIAINNKGQIFTCDGAYRINGIIGNRISRMEADGSVTPIVLNYGGNLAMDNLGNLYAATGSGNNINRIITTNYYAISPSLPKGLEFDELTGTISGTPGEVSALTTYTITAYNSGGSGSTIIRFKVSKPAAPLIKYSTANAQVTPGTPVSLTPSNSGGAVPATVYGQTTTLAGNVNYGFKDGTGTSASFFNPAGIYTDGLGTVYVSDYSNGRIRKITPAGQVSTFAGADNAATLDDYGTNARFQQPQAIAKIGTSLFIRDNAGYIRQINADGLVSTMPLSIYVNNGASAYENGLVFDTNGTIYEGFINTIRKIVQKPGLLLTNLAGNNAKNPGFANGRDTAARFNGPKNVVLDASGNIFVADIGNHQIRKVTQAGVASTFAGSTTLGAADGTGAAAQFYNPYGLTFNAAGDLFVSDAGNNLIRRITPAGVVTTVAGNGNAAAADGTGAAASFNGPQAIAIDGNGILYVADTRNNMIRKVITTGYTISPALPAGLVFDATTGTISGTPVTNIPATVYTVTAYNNGGSVSTTITLSSAQAQTITFNPIPQKTLGTANFDPGATASSGLAITYSSSNKTVASIVNNMVHIKAAGTTTITATQAGNDNYLPASASQQLTVGGLAAQTITFTAPATQPYGTADFDPGASASSSLPVQYVSSNIKVATIVSNKVHIVGIGNTIITASQPGNGSYDAAPSINRKLVVVKGDQTITFAALASATFGDANFTISATASSGLPVTFTSANTDIAVAAGNKVHIVAAGTVTITASQAGNTLYNAAVPVNRQLVISPQMQTITFKAIQPKTYGVADFALAATATSKLGVTFSSSDVSVATVTDGQVHVVGAGTAVITASQPGNGNFSKAPDATQTLTVKKAALTVTADDQTKIAGQANPVLTITYSGFVNGDTEAQLTTPPVISTTAKKASGAGAYPIIVSRGVSNNYIFTYVNGTLTITASGSKALTAQSNSFGNSAGDNAAPQVSVAVSPNGDGINDVLSIANINKYPDNKLTLVNKGGAKIYQVAGYDNVNKAFNGYSNISGTLQPPGTYFYQLQYRDNGIMKSISGYIVISY